MAGVLTEIASRFMFSEHVILTVPGQDVQAAMANPVRYALGFALTNGAAVVVTTNLGESGSGGTVIDTGHIRWFYAKDVGPLAFAAWFARDNGGASELTVFEVTQTS